jgi:hypothetical protein
MMQETDEEGDTPSTALLPRQAGMLLSTAALVARFMNVFTCGSFGYFARVLLTQQTHSDGTYQTSAVYQNGQKRLEAVEAPHQKLMSSTPGTNVAKNAVLVMKEQQKTTAAGIKRLELLAQDAKEQAIAWRDKRNNAQAMTWLKKMKLFQAQAARLLSQSGNMDVMAINVEGVAMTAQNAAALAAGGAAMKQIQGSMNVEHIQDMMGEIDESMREGDEVIDAVSKPFEYNATAIELQDEDALNAELNALGTTDEASQDAAILDLLDRLPQVPKAAVTKGSTFDLYAPPVPKQQPPRTVVPTGGSVRVGVSRANDGGNDRAAMEALARQLDQ